MKALSWDAKHTCVNPEGAATLTDCDACFDFQLSFVEVAKRDTVNSMGWVI